MHSNSRGKRRPLMSTRSGLLSIVQLLLLLTALVLTATPVFAVHDLGLLCLDGNAVGTGGCPSSPGAVDWDSINPIVNNGVPNLPANANNRVFKPQCTSQNTSSTCVPAGT